MEYSKAPVSELLYSRYPKLIDSIVERRTMRVFPRSGSTSQNYTSGGLVEFEITQDQFMDLQSAVLHFDLVFTGATAVAQNGQNPALNEQQVLDTCRISNAVDIVGRFDCYYNDSRIESQLHANAWANAFLAYGATKNYLENEGSALLGVSNQAVQCLRGAGNYAVPVCLFSPFFRNRYYLPILGNRLRFNIQLDQDQMVISKRVQAGITYRIENVSLSYDMVIVQPAYRSEVIKAMSTPEGFRIPYTAYQTNVIQATTSAEQNFRISNNLSNALSLHLLYDPPRLTSNVAIATIDEGEAQESKWLLNRQCFPVAGFTRMRVSSGSKVFTPTDDARTYLDLYVSAEKTINNLCDFSGSGYVNYWTLIGGYTPDADLASASADYGLCVLSTNLEKTLTPDDAVINQGLSSMEQGASAEFDVMIQGVAGSSDDEARNGRFRTSGRWLTNIVHKGALVFSSGSVSAEI